SSTTIPSPAAMGSPCRWPRAPGGDAHVASASAPLHPHVAVHLCEQRAVRAQPHVGARLEPRTALAHQNGTAGHELPGEPLDTEHLWIGVPPVPRAADTFLVSHETLRPRSR